MVNHTSDPTFRTSISPQDAEEWTQSLGQLAGGFWRSVLLARNMGVPQALGLTVDEWRLRTFGELRLSIEERREAAKELVQDGLSRREIAGVLGVTHTTVRRDLSAGTIVPELIENHSTITQMTVDAGTIVPAQDEEAIHSFVDQPGIPLDIANRIATKLSSMIPEDRAKILEQSQSPDEFVRREALAIAADVPPPVDPALASLDGVELELRRAVKVCRDDAIRSEIKCVQESVKDIIARLEQRYAERRGND